MPDQIFWEIHSELPREGPGDNESTRRAFALMGGLPAELKMLDVACGPGMQTLELLRISNANIVGADTHQDFLEELWNRAEHGGFTERVKTVNASMHSLPFEENEFNVIWCEGAMYIMGVPQALTDWKRLLAPGGYIAFTEPCFLKDDLPSEVQEHWAEYSAMTNVENTLKIIKECGYIHIDHFTIPESSWWHDYYTPQEARLEMLRQKYANSPSALARIEETQKEIDTHREYSSYYGYVFFIIRKPV